MEVLLVALVVAALIALARIAFPRNGVEFEDLLRRTDLEWPHGVQEEEPAPWHVKRLQAHSRR